MDDMTMTPTIPYENNVYLSKLKANFSPLKFTFWP